MAPMGKFKKNLNCHNSITPVVRKIESDLWF